MKTIVRFLLRWERLSLAAAIVAVLGAGVLLVAGGSAQDSGQAGDSSSSPTALLLLGLVLIPVVLALGRFVVVLAGVDPDADRIAQALASTSDQQRLLTRWLQRTRWARNVGGLAGVAWWLLGTSAQGDLLLCGIGGLAIGSIAAQLHHVAPARGTRTASLERRSVDDYLKPGWRWRMIIVLAGAIVLCLAGLFLDSTSAAIYGAVAASVMGAAQLVQRRVASRPRAALSLSIEYADDLARGLAIDRGLAQPATYFALVLIAHGASGLEPSLGGAATAISVVAWLYALYSWWHNRRLGLDFVMEGVPTEMAAV